MALDRQSIERRDFPIARRGYEIEAVDAHLGMLADEYETITRRGRALSGGGLAASASEQVRMIVEAAEQSAADIERDAELEARQLRQDAREEAERLRGDAGRQARDHVNRVAEVARGLLDRIEGMDRELGTLLDGLRAGTQRLSADLSMLQSSVEEVRDAALLMPEPDAIEVDIDMAIDEDAGLEADPEALGDPDSAVGAEPSDPASAAEPAAVARADSEPGEPGEADAGDDVTGETAVSAAVAGDAALPAAPPGHDVRAAGEQDGARMVALNMALNGVDRDDTRHHIEENFDVSDVEALLDDVYARVVG